MKLLKRAALIALSGVIALSMLTGCGGSSSSSGDSISDKAVDYANIFLKADGYETAITADSTLTKKAGEYADVLEKYVAVSDPEDSKNIDINDDVWADRNDIEYHLGKKVTVRLIGKLNGTLNENESRDWHWSATNDERRAQVLAGDIEYLLASVDDEDYGKTLEDDEFATKITGVGVAEVTDANLPDNRHDDTTRTFSGWVVLIAYE